jgi:hypothetical protein
VSEPDRSPPEADEEVVDGLPVVAETYALEPARPALVPARQAAALAATGFVAGACTVAVVQHRRMRVGARRRRKRKASGIGEIMSSNSFLVDVHLLRRD